MPSCNVAYGWWTVVLPLHASGLGMLLQTSAAQSLQASCSHVHMNYCIIIIVIIIILTYRISNCGVLLSIYTATHK